MSLNIRNSTTKYKSEITEVYSKNDSINVLKTTLKIEIPTPNLKMLKRGHDTSLEKKAFKLRNVEDN